ncbi:MAG: hypothetical protein R3F46_06190 [bacterium]
MRLITTILLCLALLSQLAAAADEAYISLSGLSIGMSRAELLELGLRLITAEEQAADSHLLGFSMIRELPGERDLVLLQGELAVHVHSWFSRSGNAAADQPLYAELRERLLAENTPRGWMYPEYFSYEGFDRYESFIGSGGILAFLGDSRDRVLENQMQAGWFSAGMMRGWAGPQQAMATLLQHEQRYLDSLASEMFRIEMSAPVPGSTLDQSWAEQAGLVLESGDIGGHAACLQYISETGPLALSVISSGELVLDSRLDVHCGDASPLAYRFYREQLDRISADASMKTLTTPFLQVWQQSVLAMPSAEYIRFRHAWQDGNGNVTELVYDWDRGLQCSASLMQHSQASWDAIFSLTHIAPDSAIVAAVAQKPRFSDPLTQLRLGMSAAELGQDPGEQWWLEQAALGGWCTLLGDENGLSSIEQSWDSFSVSHAEQELYHAWLSAQLDADNGLLPLAADPLTAQLSEGLDPDGNPTSCRVLQDADGNVTVLLFAGDSEWSTLQLRRCTPAAWREYIANLPDSTELQAAAPAPAG